MATFNVIVGREAGITEREIGMFFHTILRLPVAGSFALIALAAGAATAEAADVTVTDAKIAGGKLVITGTTSSPEHLGAPRWADGA